MCRPGHGSSRDLPTGGHIGPPLRGGGGVPEPTEIGGKRRLSQRGMMVRPGRRGEVTPPYGDNERSAQQRHAVPRAWPPPTKFRPEIWGVGQVVVPYESSAGGARQRAENDCFFCQGFAFALVSTAGQCYTIDALRDCPLRGPRIAALAAEERNDPHAANEAVPE